MIYFCRELDGAIYMGWTDNLARRAKAHASARRVLIAARPGDEACEKELHAVFGDELTATTSIYIANGRLESYIASLLERRLAADNVQDADGLPKIPFELWSPDAMSRPLEDRNGQIPIWEAISVKDRKEFIGSSGELFSISDEWYTPAYVIEAARRAMGSIDTDPATCLKAQDTVRATKFRWTKDNDGLILSNKWAGNVWLNPPYGRGESSAGKFIKRLVDEVRGNRVTQAVTCLNLASADAEWFAPLWKIATAHCIARKRIAFVSGDGKTQSQPNKGTIFSYVGNPQREVLFAQEFSEIGYVLKLRDQQ